MDEEYDSRLKRIKNKAKKFGVIGVGVLGTEALNHAFDFVMYPLVIGLLGPIKGGGIMTLFALVLNYLLVIGYHKTKQDWFGFEWMALKRQEEAQTLSGKILRLTLHIGHWPAFIFLCWEDPFKAFIFIRGRKASGFSFDKADWFWFFLSNFVGNLIWILLVTGAIEAIRPLFS